MTLRLPLVHGAARLDDAQQFRACRDGATPGNNVATDPDKCSVSSGQLPHGRYLAGESAIAHFNLQGEHFDLQSFTAPKQIAHVGERMARQRLR